MPVGTVVTGRTADLMGGAPLLGAASTTGPPSGYTRNGDGRVTGPNGGGWN